ncbi:MAG: glycine cleavage system aminomethyltransferase GcvT [Bacteriovoracaceae bacterium]|nr:glycine cleavage system aminomethyltransferase GcvT [Bacteriovoracaceae bacterium]
MSNLTTSLHAKHLELKAKMAPFAGFEMPIQYTSVKEEVIAVRENVGVFDVSHMGEFFVEGPDAHKFVDHIMTNDFSGAGALKAVYSPLCRDNGTVIDDLIAYKLGDERVLICVNAANIEKDWNWISSKTEGFNVSLKNDSDNWSLLAVQGPKTEEVLRSLELLDSDEFPYYSIKETNLNSEHIILARTGYTGEDGFEIFCNHEFVEQLWDRLLEKNVTPCGLAARDVLRLEVCYPLYGHEIHDEVTPLDSALKWTVKMSKQNFIGKAALENYSPKFKLAKIILDKGIPREGYVVENEAGEAIGHVTSGTMSVVLGKGIALAHINHAIDLKQTKLFVNIRNRKYEAERTTKAFVSGGHK